MKGVDLVPFGEAFLNEPVGKLKVQESNYLPSGTFRIVDQGKALIAGFSNEVAYLKDEPPYILFGDHTKVVKYIDFPFIVGADGVRLYKASKDFDPLYLYYYLKSASLPTDGYGRHSKYLEELLIPKYKLTDQQTIASQLKQQFAEIEKAREAIEVQIKEVSCLANAIIYGSLNSGTLVNYSLGDALDEVRNGIGASWKEYPVYGATRKGIALAKEPPGKNPQRYKPIVPGTVFYNPMRILIGSIAFAEDDVEDGITSPDYVVLKGKEGLVNSRWFYYWLRSPLGQQCITSLARGAVRERMLFNRLAEGNIDLPDFTVQKKAAEALKDLKQVRANIDKQYQEVLGLSSRLLSNIFQEV